MDIPQIPGFAILRRASDVELPPTYIKASDVRSIANHPKGWGHGSVITYSDGTEQEVKYQTTEVAQALVQTQSTKRRRNP